MRVLCWIVALVFVVFGSTLWFIPPPAADLDDKIDIAVLCLIMAGSVVTCLLAIPRGTWVIDSEGITFTSLYSRSSRLLWEDIEQVQWMSRFAIVRFGKTAITLRWHIYDGDDATRARQIVESALSPAFDLTEYQTPQLFRPGLWPAFIWFAKMVAISIPLTAISLSGTLVAALWAPHASWAEVVALITLFSPWLLLIPVAMQTRRRYPRWRKRRHDARGQARADPALPR